MAESVGFRGKRLCLAGKPYIINTVYIYGQEEVQQDEEMERVFEKGNAYQ